MPLLGYQPLHSTHYFLFYEENQYAFGIACFQIANNSTSLKSPQSISQKSVLILIKQSWVHTLYRV
jgi:hypothetical protein